MAVGRRIPRARSSPDSDDCSIRSRPGDGDWSRSRVDSWMPPRHENLGVCGRYDHPFRAKVANAMVGDLSDKLSGIRTGRRTSLGQLYDVTDLLECQRLRW